MLPTGYTWYAHSADPDRSVAAVRCSSMAAPWKFLLMCMAITLCLLVVYDVLIRYTFIGAMLNGRKTRPPLFRRSPVPVEAQAQP